MARLFLLAVFLLSASALAQTPAATPTPHPLTVNPDHTITFRLLAPAAKQVSVSLDRFEGHPLTMTRAADGLWSVTTPPLAPEYNGYNLIVDGVTQLDPLNPDTRFNYVYLANQVLVPGSPAEPWELTSVPHGRVDHIRFTSHVVQHLPNNQSAYAVYTPPNYDPKRKGGYPVLYLLHGWSDNETAWAAIGHADLILDNLIATGKAVPMIVVMPLAYGDLDFVTHGFDVWQDAAKVSANVALFGQSLFTEVIPAVEQTYNIAKGRENTAIAGLSMGGLESVSIGLHHTDRFAWIGGMSAAVFDPHFLPTLPALDAKSANLRLFWIACGTDEPLLAPNRALVAWGRTHGLPTTAVEIPGAHVWLTWRDNLVHLAPLLFQPRS
jgi:enterochelin esterase family protein